MSAKKVKQRSGKRVTQEKAVDSGNLQSAASRRSAEAEVQLLIEKFSPSHLHLIGDMRRWLLKRLPTAHQIVYEYRDCFVISYSPSEHGYEGVFGIRGSEECVRLYFNSGKGLPDTKKLLQGSGGQARYARSARGRGSGRSNDRSQSSTIRDGRPRHGSHSSDNSAEASAGGPGLKYDRGWRKNTRQPDFQLNENRI